MKSTYVYRCVILKNKPYWKSISTGTQYVTPESKICFKNSQNAGLAQEIGFSAPNLCSLPRLLKGATQWCTSKKECNKLDLIAVQYF
jgi:hypothetical protein